MFRSNFDDFVRSGHHQNRPRVGEFENRARMTPICNWNILRMFKMQFLSFSVSTAEKYFVQILTTFPAPKSSITRKVKTG